MFTTGFCDSGFVIPLEELDEELAELELDDELELELETAAGAVFLFLFPPQPVSDRLINSERSKGVRVDKNIELSSISEIKSGAL